VGDVPMDVELDVGVGVGMTLTLTLVGVCYYLRHLLELPLPSLRSDPPCGTPGNKSGNSSALTPGSRRRRTGSAWDGLLVGPPTPRPSRAGALGAVNHTLQPGMLLLAASGAEPTVQGVR